MSFGQYYLLCKYPNSIPTLLRRGLEIRDCGKPANGRCILSQRPLPCSNCISDFDNTINIQQLASVIIQLPRRCTPPHRFLCLGASRDVFFLRRIKAKFNPLKVPLPYNGFEEPWVWERTAGGARRPASQARRKETLYRDRRTEPRGADPFMMGIPAFENVGPD